jgi:hypothetical protein
MVKVEWELGRRDQWMYRLFGPTTLHLQHEFYLLLSLFLLTVSSLKSLYHKDFGLWTDYQFLFWSTLWLSRHLFTRWLCTWDDSTNRRPSLLGVIGHWMTSHILAGQYFDRPTPQVVSKTVGTPLADDGRVIPTMSSFLLPSILYTWQLIKVRMWYPLLQLYEIVVHVLDPGGSGGGGGSSSSNNSEAGSDVSSTPVTSSRRAGERGGATNNQHRHPHSYLTAAYSYWTKGWALYGPPLQLTIPVCVMTFYIWHLFFAASGSSVTTHALTMSTRNGQSQDPSHFENKPYGAYKKLEMPDWTQVLYYLSCGGTLASILLYGRLILPIPDLVAGSNVLKAVRNEAKLLGSQSGTGVSKHISAMKRLQQQFYRGSITKWLRHDRL